MASKDVAVISGKILSQIRKGVDVTFPTPDSVVLHSKEFNSIRTNSKYVSSADNARLQQQEQQAKLERNQKAQARKTRMMQLQKNARNAKPAMSALQKKQQKEREQILDEASAKILKNHDKVKKMDSLVLYAKCAAIRDRQLTEKGLIAQQRKQKDQQMDALMEIDRLNAIEQMAARDRTREQLTKASAQVIVAQLRENETQRMMDKELKVLEGAEMVRRIKVQQREEDKKQQRKHAEGKQLLADIKRSNQRDMECRAAEKRRQIVEDEKIAAYIKEKEAREALFEREQAEIEAHKERKKEKISAKQGQIAEQEKELENIRIRRSQEKAEREWRNAQKCKAVKKEATKQELFEARERQRLEKELRLAEQAIVERAEFEKNVNAFHAQQHEIERQQIEQHVNKEEYRAMLQRQMAETQKLRSSQRQVDTDISKRDLATEQAQLCKVRDQKIEELKKYGVPDKYMADLKRFKVAMK